MPFYEIVYETGNHSLANYANDEEAQAALQNHHERAKNGQPALPGSDIPAERIAKVYVYDQHPVEFGVGEMVPAQQLTDTLTSLTDADGLVSVPQAAAAVRQSSSPMMDQQEVHGSSYAMPVDHELPWTN